MSLCIPHFRAYRNGVASEVRTLSRPNGPQQKYRRGRSPQQYCFMSRQNKTTTQVSPRNEYHNVIASSAQSIRIDQWNTIMVVERITIVRRNESIRMYHHDLQVVNGITRYHRTIIGKWEWEVECNTRIPSSSLAHRQQRYGIINVSSP